MKKRLILISIALIGLLTIIGVILSQPARKPIKADFGETASKLEFKEITNPANTTNIKIKYHLPVEQPIVKVVSPQIKNIDVEKLENVLGKQNIGVDYENETIHLNLRENVNPHGNGEFVLETLNKNKMELTFFNIEDEELLYHVLNDVPKDTTTNNNSLSEEEISSQEHDANAEKNPTEESTSESNTETSSPENPDVSSDEQNKDQSDDKATNDDETNKNSGWKPEDDMFISLGKPQKKGDITVYPAMYFGAINYALNTTSIKHSLDFRPVWTLSGHGRHNNITAANSSMIVVHKNGDVGAPQEKKSNKNSYYTTTFGDGNMPDQRIYQGSQRNFMTTNIYDISLSHRNKNKPFIMGPDGKDNGGLLESDIYGLDSHSPKIYYKSDPNTGLTMQRLVYEQTYKKYRVQIKTTQKFTDDNEIVIHTEYKNIGKKDFDRFTGYTFRDITFMKNRDFNNRESDNDILSLGNNEGLYAGRHDEDGRIEFYMNKFPDSPYAWSGRGTRSTFFTTNGKDHFPFNTTAYKGNSDAFKDVHDTGDKLREPGAGKPWLKKNEIGETGVSMHTKEQPLKVGETTSMTYSTKMIEKLSPPSIRLYKETSPSNIHELTAAELKSFPLAGNWYHYGDKQVTVKYLIDDDDPEHIKQNGHVINQKDNTQTDEEMNLGKLKEFSGSVSLGNLSEGVHKISLMGIDGSDNISKVKNIYIQKPTKVTNVPQIDISSPSGLTSEVNPYTANSDTIDLAGHWSDLDSKNVNLHYQIDDGPKQAFLEQEKNQPGNKIPWTLESISLRDIKDHDVHSISLTIDDNDHEPVVKKFYFKRKLGGLQLDAPRKIAFGQHVVQPEIDKKVAPKINGNLIHYDDRVETDNGAKITLSIHELTLDDDEEDEDNVGTSSTKTLKANVLWNNQIVPFDEPFVIKNGLVPKGKGWVTETDLTELVKEHLKLNIKKNQTVTAGHYHSTWTWDSTDSI